MSSEDDIEISNLSIVPPDVDATAVDFLVAQASGAADALVAVAVDEEISFVLEYDASVARRFRDPLFLEEYLGPYLITYVSERLEDTFDRLLQELMTRAVDGLTAEMSAPNTHDNPRILVVTPVAALAMRDVWSVLSDEEQSLLRPCFTQIDQALEGLYSSEEHGARIPLQASSAYSPLLLDDPDFVALSERHRAQLLKLANSVLEIVFPRRERVVPALIKALQPRVIPTMKLRAGRLHPRHRA